MKRILTFTLLAWLMAAPVWAAPAFVDVTTASGTTSTTHDHTFTAGVNMGIICATQYENGGAVASIASLTVGGAAATFLDGITETSLSRGRVELWYFPSPTTGSALSVVVTGGSGTDNMITGVMGFSGVGSFNTQSKAEGYSTNADVDSIASAVGELGVMCGGHRLTAGASADATTPVSTERFESAAGGGNITGWGYTEAGAATSINMRVDVPSERWTAVAVSMREAAASTRRPIAPIIFQ